MDRIYLFVPPEEYAEVKASGGCWDAQSKRWYIRGDLSPAKFSHWLGGEEAGAPFAITSDDALVAAARLSCAYCDAKIEVICLYCESATHEETGEPMTQCTLSNVWAMDLGLAEQLAPWPQFRKSLAAEAIGCFANHCPYCGTVQEDYLLHSEPGDVFFALSQAQPGLIEFTPLVGRVRVGGDYSFEV